jgi:hypothetical protein
LTVFFASFDAIVVFHAFHAWESTHAAHAAHTWETAHAAHAWESSHAAHAAHAAHAWESSHAAHSRHAAHAAHSRHAAHASHSFIFVIFLLFVAVGPIVPVNGNIGVFFVVFGDSGPLIGDLLDESDDDLESSLLVARFLFIKRLLRHQLPRKVRISLCKPFLQPCTQLSGFFHPKNLFFHQRYHESRR